MDWTLLFEEHIDNIGISLDVFAVFRFGDFSRFEFFGLVCIVGELAEGVQIFLSVLTTIWHMPKKLILDVLWLLTCFKCQEVKMTLVF